MRRAVEEASTRVGDLLPRVARRLSLDVQRHVHAQWIATTPAEVEARTGRVLWVHRLMHVRPISRESDNGWTLELMPQSSAQPFVARDEAGESWVAAGIGTSVVCSHASDKTFLDMGQAIELANVAWAATQEQAGRIVGYTASVAEGRRSERLGQLRSLAHTIAAVQHDASFFRAVLHDQINALSPQQMDCWEATARAWRLGPHIEELDRRRGELRNAHQETADYLQSLYSDRLNRVMASLTVFGGLSVLTALIDYAFGGPLSHVQVTRVWVLLASAIFLGGVTRMLWVNAQSGTRNRGRGSKRAAVTKDVT